MASFGVHHILQDLHDTYLEYYWKDLLEVIQYCYSHRTYELKLLSTCKSMKWINTVLQVLNIYSTYNNILVETLIMTEIIVVKFRWFNNNNFPSCSLQSLPLYLTLVDKPGRLKSSWHDICIEYRVVSIASVWFNTKYIISYPCQYFCVTPLVNTNISWIEQCIVSNALQFLWRFTFESPERYICQIKTSLLYFLKEWHLYQRNSRPDNKLRNIF